jgi:hypothetical protein
MGEMEHLLNSVSVFISAHAQDLKNFFESVFVTSVAGALAGAFFGAWGAQRIAERSKQRDEILVELRSTNAAISVVFYISNALLSFKKQEIRPLKATFDAQREAISKILERAKANPAESVSIRHIGDYRSLSTLSIPIPIIEKLGFDNLSVGVKALTLISTLTNTALMLNQAIVGHNKLIDFVKTSNLSDREAMFCHLGLEYTPGSSNKEYSDNLEAIYSFTDDGIFFSRQLLEELIKHGEAKRLRFQKRYGRSGDLPIIAKPLFAKAEEAGLMPDPAKYTDWQSMFVDPKNAKT